MRVVLGMMLLLPLVIGCGGGEEDKADCSDTDNASSISNREYEEREQDKKRSIRLLNQRYLNDFIE